MPLTKDETRELRKQHNEKLSGARSVFTKPIPLTTLKKTTKTNRATVAVIAALPILGLFFYVLYSYLNN